MYGKHPETLDYSIYNDLENYKTEKLPQPGYVHQPDLGELLEITPDLRQDRQRHHLGRRHEPSVHGDEEVNFVT